MFSYRKLQNFPLPAGHKKWLTFLLFFLSTPVPCNFCLLCVDEEFYLVFRDIWFIYVFSNDKWTIFHFFTDSTEITEKQLATVAILSDSSRLTYQIRSDMPFYHIYRTAINNTNEK